MSERMTAAFFYGGGAACMSYAYQHSFWYAVVDGVGMAVCLWLVFAAKALLSRWMYGSRQAETPGEGT